MQRRPWLALLGFLAASFAASAIGGWATSSSVRTWYPALVKPAWNPPSSVFAPVWTTLYIMMAVAAWRVWRRRDEVPEAPAAVALFFVQLGLNALWSVLFFGLRSPAAASLEIVLLWTTLAILQVRFWRIDRVAGVLWFPYLAWVTFATVLTFTLWRLN